MDNDDLARCESSEEITSPKYFRRPPRQIKEQERNPKSNITRKILFPVEAVSPRRETLIEEIYISLSQLAAADHLHQDYTPLVNWGRGGLYKSWDFFLVPLFDEAVFENTSGL